jgi:hypothetical protein
MFSCSRAFMLDKIKQIWTIKDLRNKILFVSGAISAISVGSVFSPW